VAVSFTVSFAVAATVLLAFTVLVFFFVPDVPPSAHARSAAGALPLRVAFKNPVLLAHFLAFALYFACSTMGMMNLPLLLLHDLRGSEKDIGIAYSVAPVFELPFMVYMGVLATRVRHERLVALAMGIAVVYYAGLALAGRPLHVYVLQILSAAIVAVMSGVAISFFQTFLPNQAGSATNLYSSASRVGSMLGYLSFGAIAGHFGHRAVFFVSAITTLLCAAIVHGFRRATAASSGVTG
jgi:MFS transporter, SET family, sugar efflux transporter